MLRVRTSEEKNRTGGLEVGASLAGKPGAVHTLAESVEHATAGGNAPGQALSRPSS